MQDPVAADPGTTAQSSSDLDANRSLLPIGAGVTFEPNTFLIGGAADFALDRNLSVGPALQIGWHEDRKLFAPFAQLKYSFDIDGEDGKPSWFKPFVQAGAGAVYIDQDRGGSEWGPLLNVGPGIRFLTGDNYRIGSTMLFNFIPGGAAGEEFYVSWEILQVVMSF